MVQNEKNKNPIPQDQDSQIADSETNHLIKNEVNFMLYPMGNVWGKSNKKTIIYRNVIRVDGMEKEIIWKALGTDEHGLPGPGAMETDMAITKLINQKRWPVGIILETTLYEIAVTKGVTPNGNNINLIKKDLRELGTISFESKYTFKGKWLPNGEKYLNAIVRKYDAIILKGDLVSEKLQAEIPTDKYGRSDKVYIVLSELYRSSLNSHYTRELDYDFMMSLPGALEKRL